MGSYLCYDLKGIQRYIFQVPKLKCCIGGSRQIDDFDRSITEHLTTTGCKKIFSGGGKGAFYCENDSVLETLKKELVEKAMEKGLTIRFGKDENYSKAAQNIVETFCYQPASLEGQPCRVSGLYPTTSKDGVNSLISQRIKQGSEHDQKSATEKAFLEELRQTYPGCEFFYDVDANDPDGREGAEALGNRNRWAVICMDGNDIGSQFQAFQQESPWETNQDKWKEWLPKMSKKLDDCTRVAAQAGMKAVADAYFQEEENKGRVVLPIRPLIVGGDDVTVLVGCKYATLFVKTVMEKFAEKSAESGDQWLGTGGTLSISAGILFAPVSLPIHSALAFAEELLSSAKTRGRALKGNTKKVPSPACLDWESVTEGLLESVASRRKREFRFLDKDADAYFELTCRPYSLEDFEKLEEFSRSIGYFPNTLKQNLHQSLFACKADRLRYYAKIAKNYPALFQGLMEPVPVQKRNDDKYGEYWDETRKEGGNTVVRTRLVDCFLLDQEEHRMTQETTGR